MLYTYSNALRWCTQLAMAVGHVHQQQPMIIHRDLRLDNVLLTGTALGILGFQGLMNMTYWYLRVLGLTY